MAKTLKDFLNERQLGPMVVKNPDEQKFIDKHVVAKTADRNGNDDELFKGSKVKMADRPKHRKGYNPGQDEEVYEEIENVDEAAIKLTKGWGDGGKSMKSSYGKLIGNQHKIDVNKNGKVDAHDFHLLRNKKKVAEEDLDEGFGKAWDPYTPDGPAYPKAAYSKTTGKLNKRSAAFKQHVKDHYPKSLHKQYGVSEEAPQFVGKSQKKRQVMAIAAKLSAERGGKPLNKEEHLLAKLGEINESHQTTMLTVFDKLNEDNQRAFMQACETHEGIEQMLDFSIQYRGE